MVTGSVAEKARTQRQEVRMQGKRGKRERKEIRQDARLKSDRK